MTAHKNHEQPIMTTPTAAASIGRSSPRLIETRKMNGVDPQAYLRDVLARIVARHRSTTLESISMRPSSRKRVI
jgi:hypothetical protein